MRCIFCGGPVHWVGTWGFLHGTQCQECGRRDCQIVDPPEDDDTDDEGEQP